MHIPSPTQQNKVKSMLGWIALSAIIHYSVLPADICSGCDCILYISQTNPDVLISLKPILKINKNHPPTPGESLFYALTNSDLYQTFRIYYKKSTNIIYYVKDDSILPSLQSGSLNGPIPFCHFCIPKCVKFQSKSSVVARGI